MGFFSSLFGHKKEKNKYLNQRQKQNLQQLAQAQFRQRPQRS